MQEIHEEQSGDRMELNEKVVTRYLNDREFQEVLFGLMAKQIYDDVRTGIDE